MDGIAVSNHVINLEPGLVMDDAVAWERLKYMVRAAVFLKMKPASSRA